MCIRDRSDTISLFHQKQIPETVSRDLKLPVNTGKIIALNGVRRCGKTYLMYDTIAGLLKKKVPVRNILFLSFEDERLNFTSDTFDLILQAYLELYPDIDLGECYFFFDEIQNARGWEQFVRRIYDSVSRNIFISGSNSKMLGSEIAGALRGRTLQYTVYPLSFDEYLRFCRFDKKNKLPSNKALLNNLLKEYLMNGGFPETIGYDELLRRNTLQEYYQVMLFKDVMERYGITAVSTLKYFVQRLLACVANPFSVNKVYLELKLRGFKISKDYLYNWLDHLESIHFVYSVTRYDTSVVKKEMGEKKIYSIDNGLLNALYYGYTDDRGKLFENMVYLMLRNKYGSNLYFYKDHKECDFILLDRNHPSMAIQACYSLNDPSTLDREIKGLLAVREHLKIKKLLLVVFEESKMKVPEGINLVAFHSLPEYI